MKFSRPVPLEYSWSIGCGPGNELVAEIAIEPTIEIFSGHYPHFPILPGVYLIELALRTIELHLQQSGFAAARIHAIKSARLLLPVLPGTTVKCIARPLLTLTDRLADWDVVCMLGEKQAARVKFTAEGLLDSKP